MVDDGDPVGELIGLLQVLGGQQHGGTGGDQLADQRPQVAAAGRVQPSGRLVQEQHAGPADQGGAQVKPAAHPTRIGLDLAVGRLQQANALQHLAGTLARLAAGQPVEPPDHLDVLAAGEDLVDGRGLAGQPDPGAHPGWVGADVDPGDAGGAPSGWSKVASTRMRVVLPAPLGPSRP